MFWQGSTLPSYRAGRVATLAEFVRRLRERMFSLSENPPPSERRNRTLITHILPQLGMKKLDEIGGETIQAFVFDLVTPAILAKSVLNIVGNSFGDSQHGQAMGLHLRRSFAFGTVGASGAAVNEKSRAYFSRRASSEDHLRWQHRSRSRLLSRSPL